MRVCVLINNHPRSKRIGAALATGCESMRWKATIANFDCGFDDSQKFDLIAGYGWCHASIFEHYKSKGTNYIYIDLGYWHRKVYRSDYNGFHKCVLNARHPTVYYQRGRDSSRVTIDAPEIQPWRRRGNHIVLAGMSAKGAVSLGLPSMQWERGMVEKLRRVTKRSIVYRPKPSWKGFSEIEGTTLSLDPQPISEVLINAHALVTYYSNTSFDALTAGVPIYTVEGAAKPFSIDKVENIENANQYMTCDRQQLLNDISYCHFTKDEIGNGTMFRQFVDDGLL